MSDNFDEVKMHLRGKVDAETGKTVTGSNDMAIAALESNRRLQYTPGDYLLETDPCPDDTFVNCIGGLAYQWNDSSIALLDSTAAPLTCAAACDAGNCGEEKCCIGTDACKFTRACIKKDLAKPPCDGSEACRNAGASSSVPAEKPVITNGSCRGEGACSSLGGGDCDGAVALVDNSCIGEYACSQLAECGEVSIVQNSCCGEDACTEHCFYNAPDRRFPGVPPPCGRGTESALVNFNPPFASDCPSSPPSSAPTVMFGSKSAKSGGTAASAGSGGGGKMSKSGASGGGTNKSAKSGDN